MKLVLAEKPSVAQSIAKVLGAAKREDGYLEGNGYVVSWCVGHLVELAQPEVYDAKYSKWAYADLPTAIEEAREETAVEVAKVLKSQLDKLDSPKRESVMEKLAQAAEKAAPASPSPKRKEPER